MNIGFGNIVNADKIIAMITPDSAPAKRMIQKAKEESRLIDATQGRRTRAVIFTENDRVILSALLPDTLSGRLKNRSDAEEEYIHESTNWYMNCCIRIFRFRHRYDHEAPAGEISAELCVVYLSDDQ